MEEKINFKEFENIEGYENLSIENRELFNAFLLNFYGGFENVNQIKPLAINYVSDKNYIGKDAKDLEAIVIVKSEIIYLNTNKSPIIIKNKQNEGIKIIGEQEKRYLRFDYMDENQKKWLHIIDSKEWY